MWYTLTAVTTAVDRRDSGILYNSPATFQSTMLSRQKAIILLTVCLLTLVLVFSNTLQQTLDSFYQINDNPQSTRNTTDEELVDVRYLYDHLVVLTAFSDNHFEEAKDMIASMQTCLPDKKIIVYDLGLSSKNKREVRKYCNVELRSFPFKHYRQPHMKHIKMYAWKPVIVKLVSQEYDVIMYGDASLRMKLCNMSQALDHLLKFPFLDLGPISLHAIEFTHDGMMKYLHYPKHGKDIGQLGTLQATCFLMWANSVMQEKLIEPWLDCALHQECIAPKGSRSKPCDFTEVGHGYYVGCHRYDQSALNLILAREFGVDSVLKGVNTTITHPTWKIVRHKTNYYNLSYCTT